MRVTEAGTLGTPSSPDGEASAGSRWLDPLAAPGLPAAAPQHSQLGEHTSPSDGAGRGHGQPGPGGDIRFRGRGHRSARLGKRPGVFAVSFSGASVLPSRALLLALRSSHAGTTELVSHTDGLQGPEAG